MVWVLWIAVFLVAGATVFILSSYTGRDIRVLPVAESDYQGRDVLASVGSHVLYASDVATIRAGVGAVEEWTRDQILACAAEEAGFENTAISRFVQARAKQLYLRDLMVEHIVASVERPTNAEIQIYMQANPELFLVERHYFQIITADSSIADSLHTRLGWGQNFQVTAQNLSLGQKAAFGGDLGFVTGGEMQLQGLPMEIVLLDGLSDVVRSSIGWHIFKVSESRAIVDSVRVMRTAAEGLYNTRIDAALDSVLLATENRLSVEVIN